MDLIAEIARRDGRIIELERQAEQIANLLFEFVPLAQYAEATVEYDRIVGNDPALRRRDAAMDKGK